MLGISPFDPVVLIKQNMTFPLIHLMYTYIEKFNTRYPQYLRIENTGRFEKIGMLDGKPISIYLTESPKITMDATG